MTPISFAWPMIGDDATMSGGSWESTLPVTNLQADTLGLVARSTDALAASSLVNVDFGVAKYAGIVALVRHNLQVNATMRVRASAASDMSAPVYDSGHVAVWSYQWDTGVLPSGHPNAATRLLTATQIAALDPKRDAICVLPSDVSARYWRIELTDTGNTDGYIQAGRLVLAPRVTAPYQFSVGGEFGFDDGTTVGRSMSRTRFYDTRPKGRTLSVTLPMLSDAFAVTVIRDMIESLGVDGQLYVVPDSSDTTSLQRRSFLANLRALSSVQYAAAGYNAMPLVLDEVL